MVSAHAVVLASLVLSKTQLIARKTKYLISTSHAARFLLHCTHCMASQHLSFALVETGCRFQAFEEVFLLQSGTSKYFRVDYPDDCSIPSLSE